MQIALICEPSEDESILEQIATKWGLIQDAQSIFALVLSTSRLELRKRDEPKLGSVYVDFVAGAAAHRRKFGGGKGQAIAKAVGLNKGVTPSIIDATAGLGRDAFVLASLGCKVQLLERHPVVAALLEDGLKRAQNDDEIGSWMKERMSMLHVPSCQALVHLLAEEKQRPDVVYLDPMYPHKKKSALVKKEMRVFQSLVGADLDADELFEPAFALANKRVVVKRPDHAQFIAGKIPSTQIETKKNRFDVYVKAAMR